MTSHYMILEVSWDGLWILSFGFSQSHGHGFWLVCDMVITFVFLSLQSGGHFFEAFKMREFKKKSSYYVGHNKLVTYAMLNTWA